MLKKLVNEYLYQNKKIVIGIFVCLVIGSTAGLAIYFFSDDVITNKLINQMQETIKLSDNGEYIKTEIIYNGIRNNIIYILMLFVFSIMLYGSLLIYILYILKGVAIGIYISTLFGVFGFWWGILVIMLLVILVNIVYLPAIIFIGVTMINYNLNVMEYRNECGKVMSFSKVIFNASFGILVIFSSVIIEQLLSNIVIKISNNL